MTEERVTKTVDQEGNSHTTHVVSDSNGESGGNAKWAFLIILVLALAGGAYFLTQTNASEIAKDNAIAEAAGEVGEAAGQIGDAAEDAAGNVSEAAQNVSENAQEAANEAADTVQGE